MSCSLQRGWARWPLKVPSNPKHSVIPLHLFGTESLIYCCCGYSSNHRMVWVDFLVPWQFPEPSLESWVLLCYMLYNRTTEENILVCLNEYCKSTVTLGALSRSNWKKSPALKTPVRPKPVENPQCKHRSSSSSLAERAEGVRRRLSPLRARIMPAVAWGMQPVNASVGVHGTSLRAGTGFLGTQLGLCLFSLPSSSVTFR